MSVVIVTDGETRAALAITRSLGRRGHRVLVASGHRRSLAAASRFAHGEVLVPVPLRKPEACADVLRRHVERAGVDLLLPVTDASLEAILPRRAVFGSAVIPFPSYAVYRRISDKAAVAEIAARSGVHVPRQLVVATPDDFTAARADGLGYPLVVKPARSISGGAKQSVQYAGHPAELEAALETLEPGAYPVLLQERVAGQGVGIFLLLWDGRLVAHFAHRRLREKPPSGGVSVYRESIVAEPALLERSTALLSALEWNGIAMVEYKLGSTSRTPYLMEINGRFWGSLQLAIDAGVDFPALLADLAMGRSVTPPASYRVGVRTRWLWGDVDHLLLRLLRSPEDLALPSSAPGRARVLWEFVRSFGPGTNLEVLKLSDPKPFLTETVNWFRSRSS